MKISVPWPVKEESQPRIKESLSLWEDKSALLLCLVEPCDDPFLEDFDTVVLERNSTDIGTEIPKCYIHDMVKAACDWSPDHEWCGFGNSDCVPVGDLIENNEDCDVLIYHRTDIKEWEFRKCTKNDKPISNELLQEIFYWREDGMSDKKVARKLNRMEIPVPYGKAEWTYPLIKGLFYKEGSVFFWGQDMFLFKKSVVEEILENYLKVKDPILSTGGFDPRLSRWCTENYKGIRVLNKIFHRYHHSEWDVSGIEYKHNGGDIPVNERIDYVEDNFILSLCAEGQKGAIPKYVKYLIGKKNPNLYKKILSK